MNKIQNHIGLIIGGAPKAGTTSLFNYLNAHPQICGSSKKEPLWFNREDSLESLEEYYKHYFEHCDPSQTRMEASPIYMSDSTAKENICNLNPKPLLVFILREPSESMFSYFRFQKYTTEFLDRNSTFKSFVNSDYGERVRSYFLFGHHLSFWLANYPKDKIIVWKLEDFKNDQSAHLNEVINRLGLETINWKDITSEVYNSSEARKRTGIHTYLGRKIARVTPTMIRSQIKPVYNSLFHRKIEKRSKEEEKEIIRLKEEFKTDIDHLAKLLDIDFSTWL